MIKYIEAEKLKDFIYRAGPYGDDSLDYREVLHAIDIQPMADVEEIKHGKWITNYNGETFCSSCKENALCDKKGIVRTTTRCPNCGARMDLR